MLKYTQTSSTAMGNSAFSLQTFCDVTILSS